MIERRSRQRFVLAAMARYRLRDFTANPISGVGQTVNVSSTGMLLRLQHNLKVGQRLEVAIDLPIPVKGPGVELTAQGRVVRVEPGCVAIQFEDRDLQRRDREVKASRSA